MPPDLLIPVRLSKEGFGTPQQIRDMPTDLVMAAVNYSEFIQDYEATFVELNKERKT